ncbi:hypothetical protein RCT45_16075, partial [Escherichia marmotae]|nr:hypothetical protein [Escherichia marmotae]
LRLSGLREHKCRPDKAVTPHPATVRRCLMRFAYQAYKSTNCRPDKAVTPHPATVRRCLMRFAYQAYGSTNAGRIRRLRRIRQPCAA